MRNDTRILFNAYQEQIANLSGISNPAESFVVEPSVQQKLESKVQESSAFLKAINIVGVDELKGEKVGMAVTGPIVSNTNTAVQDRQGIDPTGLDSEGYECRKNNSDTVLKYAKLDAWAKFPDFQTRIRDLIIERQALDRILVGWNGESYALTSDPVANPMRQDVNIGWLKKLKDKANGRFMTDSADGAANQVTVGATGQYKNIDSLVYDIKHSLLPAWAQQDPKLVVLASSEIIHDKYFDIVDQPLSPTELVARDTILPQRRLGTLPAVAVPYFPANTVIVTRLDNLSIYYQISGRRRTILDNPKRDQIDNFESSNDAYVWEDYDFVCGAGNITYV